MNQDDLPDEGDLRQFLEENPNLQPAAKTRPVPGLVPLRKMGCRLVINDSVVFNKLGQQATIPSRARYQVILETQDEQPYARPPTKVGEDWAPLDLGWLEGKSGLVHIINQAGMGVTRIPTKEQVKETEAKILEVAALVHHATTGEQPTRFALIGPGRDLRIWPDDVSKYRVRCQSGEVRVQVVVYPK